MLDLVLGELVFDLGLMAALLVVVGRGGVWSIGHAAFFAVGQVTVGYLTSRGIVGPQAALLSCVLIGIGASVAIGWCTFRLSSDYFIILSVAFIAITEGLSIALLGPSGVSGVPSLVGPHLAAGTWQYLVVFVVPVVLFLFLIDAAIERSPLGRIAVVVKKSPLIASALGLRPARIRLSLFVFGSTVATALGALAATFYGSTDPRWTSLYRSILLFCVLILFGVSSRRGAILGAALLVVIPRFLESLLVGARASYYSAELSALIFALLLLAALKFGSLKVPASRFRSPLKGG